MSGPTPRSNPATPSKPTRPQAESADRSSNRSAGSADRFGGFEPETPDPVAALCGTVAEATEAITAKYVRRQHVAASVEMGAMEAGTSSLNPKP